MVMLEKIDGRYQRATFPGDYVDWNEIFTESVICEVREETGLMIEIPKFCGIYLWFCGKVHHMVYIYLAKNYVGELCSSAERNIS